MARRHTKADNAVLGMSCNSPMSANINTPVLSCMDTEDLECHSVLLHEALRQLHVHARPDRSKAAVSAVELKRVPE